jgi:acetyl-CoA acetyltransferase
MGMTAENLAAKYNISREDCDRYALQSQQRWKAGGYRKKSTQGGWDIPKGTMVV